MKYELITAAELDATLVKRWDAIQRAAPELASPYFRPEYVQTVADVRANVQVAVISDAAEIVGFFPFERLHDTAYPVGANLSDYQGVIAKADVQWSADELMRCCHLRGWVFDHQLASQHQLSPYFVKEAESRRMDLSAGYENWYAARTAESKALAETARKLRKFQREHSIRFEWHTTESRAFEQLLSWKSSQYQRNGLVDLFALGWPRDLLHRIWQTKEPNFRGVLSAMYAGEQLVAIHFSMQSGSMLHSWFPAYDPAFSKHSPGAGLLLLMAQPAHPHGVTCIDLGKGDEPYKLTLADHGVPLAEGAIETRAVTAVVRSGWQRARDWVRNSPLRTPARASLRWLRRVQNLMARTSMAPNNSSSNERS